MIRDRTTGSICTSAFWGRIGSTHYILTAGHCVNPNWQHPSSGSDPDWHTWHHPVPTPLPGTIPSSWNIGTAEGDSYVDDPPGGDCPCSQVDIGWIDANSAHDETPYNRLYGTGHNDIVPLAYRAPDNEQLEGDMVCRSAIHSPSWHCDEITDREVHNQTVDGHRVRNLWEVPFDAKCGDSGAPYVQSKVIVPGTVIVGAAGTHSDSSDNGGANGCGATICGSSCVSYYNTVDNIQQYTDLIVCYTVSC